MRASIQADILPASFAPPALLAGVFTCSGRKPMPTNAAADAAKEFGLQHKAERRWKLHAPGGGEDASDEALLDDQLKSLGEAGRQSAAALKLCEVIGCNGIFAKGPSQDVGCGDGILDGKICRGSWRQQRPARCHSMEGFQATLRFPGRRTRKNGTRCFSWSAKGIFRC